MAVFCLVDARCLGAEYLHSALVKPECQVVRDLTSYRDYHSMRLLEFIYVHYPFVGQFIEIEPVAHVIVSGDGFRIVIYHHSPVSFIPDSLERID